MNQTVAIGLFGIVFLLMMSFIQLVGIAVELARVRKLLTAISAVLSDTTDHVDDRQEVANAKANIKHKLHRLFHFSQKSRGYDVRKYKYDNSPEMIHSSPPQMEDIRRRL